MYECVNEIREYFPERILQQILEAEREEQEARTAELFQWLAEQHYI